MLKGYTDRLTRGIVAGWAVDTADPQRVIEVAIHVDDVEFIRVRADLRRGDLAALGDYGDGCHGFLLQFDPLLPLHKALKVRVVFADTGQALGRGEAHFASIERNDSQSARPTRLPILLRTTGRSGSTLLMNKLGHHPEIAIADAYPYEVKLIEYYSYCMRIMTSYADHVNSFSPDLFDSMQKTVGFNPYYYGDFEKPFSHVASMYQFFESEPAKHLGPAFARIISGYYQVLATEREKRSAIYFAEKANITPMSWIARFLFPDLREIVLVRDVRDTLCSFRSFWGTSIAGALPGLQNLVDRILVMRREYDAQRMFLRYEDLILDEPAALSKVSEFLGLQAPFSSTIEDVEAIFSKHSTSKSAANSIGRWKIELTPPEIDECRDRFQIYQDAFGYV